MREEDPDDLAGGIARTMQRIRDGEADGAEIEAFRALLFENRQARLAYLRANQLDCMLGMAGSGFAAGTPERIVSHPARGNRLPMVLVGMAIAAAVILLAALWPEGAPQEPGISTQPIATLTSPPGSVIRGKLTLGTNTLDRGVYSFEDGVAEITFASAAQVVLEGPCSFEIIDAMTMSLNHGKLWAYCPEKARGFAILSPGGREIIDRGTEFGIEVTKAGAMDVHVFEGMVDVVDKGSRRQALDAGEAITWTAGSGAGLRIQADSGKFVTSTDLTAKRFRDYRQWSSGRGDLLLHYDFSQARDGIIRNKAAGAAGNADGRIIGADPVGGRSSGIRALQFENAGDSVAFRLDVPGSLPGLTIAMWVKVDRLERNYAALLNSDGWEHGDIHFQANRDGSLRSGINGMGSFVSGSGAVRPGQWQLLAVRWDFDSRAASFSVNGRDISGRRDPNYQGESVVPDILLGKSRIGAWDNGDSNQIEEVRDLKARIDEVMVFRREVGEEELAEIYGKGSP